MFKYALFHALFISMLLSAAEEKKLNVYNWSDYILPKTIDDFEKETGIEVQYDVYDSNQLLESKLNAGNTGYDIVVPTSSPYLIREIKAGLFQKLDKSKLTNYKNLDPEIMKLLAAHDPGNAYAIPWMWGTVGIGYNIKKIKEIMPNAPIDSLAMFFDPKIASQFASCGIMMLDSASDIIPNALIYAGLDPNSHKEEDLKKAEEILMAVRPYIRQFHSSTYIDALANGDICLVLGWSGDIYQAKNRALEAKSGVEIGYKMPKEGAQIWIDVLAVPKDAPHPENAMLFLNYLMRPEVIAENSNFINYANGNLASKKFLRPEILNNPQIYPGAALMKMMYTVFPADLKYERTRTRAWTSILSGQ